MYLNDLDHRNGTADIGLEHLRDNLVYENDMRNMLDYFDELVSKEKRITDRSERFKEMMAHLKNSKQVSKEKLTEWIQNDRPYGKSLSPYRRSLLDHPNVYDSDGEEPHYIWKE